MQKAVRHRLYEYRSEWLVGKVGFPGSFFTSGSSGGVLFHPFPSPGNLVPNRILGVVLAPGRGGPPQIPGKKFPGGPNQTSAKGGAPYRLHPKIFGPGGN